MKKFTKFMMDKGYISEQEGQKALETIKEKKPEWMKAMVDYNVYCSTLDFSSILDDNDDISEA